METIKEEWKEKGFVDEPVPEGLDLKKAIRQLCKEKDAIILAHYYTVGDIQDIADFVGDSLALARKAADTDAKMMVMCGVHFMAETCKLLSPDKTVLCGELCQYHGGCQGTHRLCGHLGQCREGDGELPQGCEDHLWAGL